MKKLVSFLFLPLIFSCGGNSSDKAETKNILENLTYTVDTVLIDSGEDIFVLNSGLGAKVISKDGGSLYFFERDPLNLVEVDLNRLKLVRKTPFQKEGPDGVGPYLVGFQLGSAGELFIQGFSTQAIFSKEGKITESLNVTPNGIDSDLANDFSNLYQRALYDFSRNRIYTQPSFEVLQKHELYLIDPKTKEAVIKPIPEMKSVREFSGTLITTSGETKMFRYYGPGSFMAIENGQLLISSGAMSGIYWLNSETDSLNFVPIQHRNFPNRMDVTVANLPTDENQFFEDRKKVFAQLNYLEPRWDESRKMYLRLGKKTFLGENRGDPPTFEVFLFAYDQDFNVLGETKIEGFKQVPENYFWKDGKLWSYVNVEDELGFAVMDFKF
ncbi:DUF4221 family protein [Algoriphagus taiwanensis]|uniref:DUF4221 domain-containing protein n=1 Tax=Algoriphagus taiwanensis TaxID=1445656 RepID=A0ABQ6Q4B6_9BACT|nr:hypothetical protein Ataiwa_21340 [Algoriphagus taiwanensis]